MYVNVCAHVSISFPFCPKITHGSLKNCSHFKLCAHQLAKVIPDEIKSLPIQTDLAFSWDCPCIPEITETFASKLEAKWDKLFFGSRNKGGYLIHPTANLLIPTLFLGFCYAKVIERPCFLQSYSLFFSLTFATY